MYFDNKIIISLVYLIVMLAIRWISIRHLESHNYRDKSWAKRWVNSAKNAIHLLIVVGLFIIWLSELRFIALSIATFVVALVIATREFIQCILGSLYISSFRAFVISDWIRIGQHSGEVLRSDWLSTTLLELDMSSGSYAYTGNTVVIPNNQFVGHSLEQLNHRATFIHHSFTLVREADTVDLFKLKAPLEKLLNEQLQPFKEESEQQLEYLTRKLGNIDLDVDSHIYISSNHLGKNEITLSYFCPTQHARQIEQILTEKFMSLWYKKQAKEKAAVK